MPAVNISAYSVHKLTFDKVYCAHHIYILNKYTVSYSKVIWHYRIVLDQ